MFPFSTFAEVLDSDNSWVDFHNPNEEECYSSTACDSKFFDR